MLQTIRTFDVDWLKGMSFALYDLEYVEAKTLADELLQIFGDANSPLAGMVRLIPIPRLNAILGISAQPDYLRQVEDWISRLDIGGSTPGRKIYVYGVKNARAGDLASALGNILATQTAGRRSSQPLSQGAAGTRQPNQPARQNVQGMGTTARGAPTQTGVGAAQPSVFEAGGLRIMANEEANALLILATPSEYGVIKAALRQMDVRPRQVLIEATLAEVTLTDELRYGVQWFFEFGNNSVAFSGSPSGGVASQFPGFSYVFEGSASARTVLNALSSVTDVDVISSPKLMVLNNQSATLQVGDQVPVATQSAVSVSDPNAPIVNSVQFRDTGVILTVTPRIGEGGAVMLDIEQEISDVVSTTTSGIDSPTIRQRKISTSVIVQDGDTIALGGLIRESVSRGKSGVPILKDIPLIGNLFSSSDRIRRRTELIILITPRIAQDTREAREILDYLKRQFQAVLGPDEQPRE
jgi:general secretion pathway protein D